MAEEFDQEAATRRNRELIYKVEDIRNMINKEVIEYYIDSRVESEEHAERNRTAIRKYLLRAEQDINALLKTL